MSKYSDNNTPTPCPYCNSDCYAEFVDVGVGMAQVSPYHCDNCNAVQIGCYASDSDLTEIEIKTGWYLPTN